MGNCLPSDGSKQKTEKLQGKKITLQVIRDFSIRSVIPLPTAQSGIFEIAEAISGICLNVIRECVFYYPNLCFGLRSVCRQ